MSVTMDPKLGGQQFEDFEHHGQEAIVRFHEFGRDDMGEIRVLEKPVYEYFSDASGQYFRRGEGEAGPTPVSADEVEHQDNIYWQFEIVSPVDSPPASDARTPDVEVASRETMIVAMYQVVRRFMTSPFLTR